MMNSTLAAGNKYSTIPKVSAVQCASYDTGSVEVAIRKAIDALGGIGMFVSKGEKILLKPNMLLPKSPDEAVTTHPEIVRAVIRLVRETGAIPIVGDSPGGRSNEKMLRHLAQKTGIGKVCEEEQVEFVFLIESQVVPFPAGRVAKSFDLTLYLGKVDGVISLAKLKTHAFTGLTGAAKNVYGLIPGLKKSEYHSRMADLEVFSGFLVDLVECVRPRLTIVDGVVGMEGDGPTAGIPKYIGRIVASDNPHALDAFLVDMVGAGSIRTVEIAKQRGLIPADTRIVGDIVAAARIDGFKMPAKPHAFGRIRGLFGGYLGESFSRKPVFSDSKCTLCGSCIEVCPAEALKKGRKNPVIDRSLCIRCYCCQEACNYNAIMLKSLLLSSLGRTAVAGMRKYMPGIKRRV